MTSSTEFTGNNTLNNYDYSQTTMDYSYYNIYEDYHDLLIEVSKYSYYTWSETLNLAYCFILKLNCIVYKIYILFYMINAPGFYIIFVKKV